MSKVEIQALRKQGATGKDIVGHLIENSATFKDKTEFAQEKYIRKKQKKYVPKFTVLQPTIRLVTEMYYSRGPIRICNLRPDSLAQVLTHSNVRAGNKMMVVESCVGLVVAALISRMAGQGELIHLYSGSAPVHQAVECYNFSKEQLSILHSYPLDNVVALRRPGTEPAGVNQDVSTNKAEAESFQTMDIEEQETEDSTGEGEKQEDSGGGEEEEDSSAVEVQEEEPMNEMSEESPKPAKRAKGKHLDPEERDRRRARRRQQLQEVKTKIEKADMDGLVVACKYHPTPIVLNLIDFIAPSRPIVIFCQYKEPLLDCYTKLRDRGGVVLLKLTETWLREYQVLPNRTHPLVNMSGGGGYILTGTTVVRDNL